MKAPSLFMFDLPEKGRTAKAVLFPVRAVGNKVTFATAAHVVNGIVGQYPFILYDSNGKEVPPLKSAAHAPVKSFVLPSELGVDLAFLEVEMEQVPSLVKLSTDPIMNDTTFFTALNVLGREEFPDQAYVTFEQKGSLLPQQYTCIENRYFDRTDLFAQGIIRSRFSLRALSIRSYPGVSGSPIWNQGGRTIGMVCGGNEELTEERPYFFLVFVPAQAIRDNLARFMR